MYNAESYISQCLDSIFSQGLDPNDYELIIVNDGSKDKSKEFVEGYLQKHSNIRLLNQENKGQSAARNLGISIAEGDYIQFIDADDYLIPNSLHQIVDYAASENNASINDLIIFGIISDVIDGSKLKNKGIGKCEWLGNGIDYIASHNYNNSPCYYWINSSFASSTC